MRMRPKSLWKISVITTPEAEDAVAELLGAMLGLPASAYTDSKTGVCTVTVYLPQKLDPTQKVRANISAGLRRIRRCGLNLGPGKIVMVKMRREDWAESWKRHFKPIEIRFKNRRDELRGSRMLSRKSGTRVTRPSEYSGKSLLIKPSWSRRQTRKDQMLIVLDPGLSFGTGHHPTTAFCLGEIVRLQKEGPDRIPRHRDDPANRPDCKPLSFLDLGAGSGILAIAAAKLGYAPVRAMDFDREAVRIARANAHANHVGPKLKMVRGDVAKLSIRPGQRRQGYDLVCANLIADLLIAERRRIVAQLKRTGTLVLAGILRSEFKAVQKSYRTLGLKLVSRRNDKEWCSGSFCFRS